MSNVTFFIVRDGSGVVDLEASNDKFQSELVKYCAERETEQETIAEAVHACFDQYKGVRINMPALCTFTLTKLNAQPENHKVLTERVMEFVRSQSQGKAADDGTVENPTSTFLIGKGKGGGVARRCDLVAKPEKATK
jgi:hypothetical protein